MFTEFCQNCSLAADEPLPHLLLIGFHPCYQFRCYPQQWPFCPNCHPSHSWTCVIPAPLHHSVTAGDEYLQQTQCALCSQYVWSASSKTWETAGDGHRCWWTTRGWDSLGARVKDRCAALRLTPSTCWGCLSAHQGLKWKTVNLYFIHIN